PYPEVADAVPDAGPLGGVIAALETSPCPLVAAVAVDMPFASPEVLKLLARLHDGEDAVVPVTDAGLEPLHAVYATTALAPLRSALGARRYGMRDALSSLTVRTVGKKEWGSIEPSGRFATNVNRPEDLDLLFGRRVQ
ncbi:MAG: molybdenum cofactor guanylyltransferase, partial [Actinomycetota bacterium]